MMEGLKRLLGYDVFISYSHHDGTVYASRLAEELSAHGYSCFFDRLEVVLGENLALQTFRVLDKCRTLVVVASPAAVDSATVAVEVERFFARRSHGARVILITFGRPLQEARWWHSVANLVYSRESDGALQTGAPSPEVLRQIHLTFSYLTRNAAVRRLAWGLTVSPILVGAVLYVLRFGPSGSLVVPTAPGWLLSLILVTMAFLGGGAIATLWGQFSRAKRSARAKSVARRIDRSGPAAFLRPFISYSHADKSFAKQLERALDRRGVRCWLDEKSIRPGDDIQEAVAKAIEDVDKVLLCCSKHSLTSWWVDNELGMAFQREEFLARKLGCTVRLVVPLNLDGALFDEGWASGYKSQLRRRLAVDFTEWQKGRKFDERVESVVLALAPVEQTPMGEQPLRPPPLASD